MKIYDENAFSFPAHAIARTGRPVFERHYCLLNALRRWTSSYGKVRKVRDGGLFDRRSTPRSRRVRFAGSLRDRSIKNLH